MLGPAVDKILLAAVPDLEFFALWMANRNLHLARSQSAMGLPMPTNLHSNLLPQPDELTTKHPLIQMMTTNNRTMGAVAIMALIAKV